jgi:glucan biosynthesis protein C
MPGRGWSRSMALINPWRLPLLFLISGIALRFAIDKSRLTQFVPRRCMRLFVPIVFGMLVICAPQAYFELYSKGETGSDFWAFYGQYLDFDMEFSILTPTWNHLWYLVYILAYTLAVVALLPLLRWLDGPAEAAVQLARTWRTGLAPAAGAGAAVPLLRMAAGAALPLDACVLQ